MQNYLDQKTMIEKEKEKLITELQDALAEIKRLSGLIPICTWCLKIRDEKGKWEKMEFYIEERSEARFTHGICPNCVEKEFPDHFSWNNGIV